MIDIERGTGRTKRQMQDAPTGAFFVWCNDVFGYPRLLAREIGRRDLRIISPSQIRQLRGMHGTAVIVDHAAHLTEQQEDYLRAHCA